MCVLLVFVQDKPQRRIDSIFVRMQTDEWKINMVGAVSDNVIRAGMPMVSKCSINKKNNTHRVCVCVHYLKTAHPRHVRLYKCSMKLSQKCCRERDSECFLMWHYLASCFRYNYFAHREPFCRRRRLVLRGMTSEPGTGFFCSLHSLTLPW